MSVLPSDEVAEDYKNSLEDLMTNDKYQISTLTTIAKENIEHAEALSRVLQNHINRAPPARKLPALYVLDSIAKNVGSPYTVYFGRNIHQTFMHAYTQVDPAVRRKLEEMLKTWREPVPGSLSTTPVFPLASTQTTVDTLNKFHAASAPRNRFQPTPIHGPPARVASAQQPYRQTPTPPQTNAPYPPNLAAMIRSPQPQATLPQVPVQSYNQTPPVTYGQPYQAQPYYQPPQPTSASQYGQATQTRPQSSAGVDVQKLHADIDDLTTDAKIACATHPMDQAAQRKLASLQTLKEILDTANPSESDLVDIRTTIMQKMAEKNVASQRPPASIATQNPYLAPQQQTPAPPPAVQPSMFNTTNLAELLRVTTAKRGTPQPNYYPPQATGGNTPLMNNVSSVAPVNENPLLAQLRASGLFSGTTTPPVALTPLVPSLSNLNPHPSTIEVPLTSSSIRIPRPHLIANFLSSKPNQCSTCGKRFTSDPVGREKKAAHLDWHFKTKARQLEAEKRGQNRSWYVDEREWISSREYEDDGGPTDSNGVPTANGQAVQVEKKASYVRAPTDAVLRNLPCPIDQESFKSEWSEEVQDFIWKDAVLVGGRYYHESCYREVMKGREGGNGHANGAVGTPTPALATLVGTASVRTGTPDSVLGKRKAEAQEDMSSVKTRVKIETGLSA